MPRRGKTHALQLTPHCTAFSVGYNENHPDKVCRKHTTIYLGLRILIQTKDLYFESQSFEFGIGLYLVEDFGHELVHLVALAVVGKACIIGTVFLDEA